MLSQQWGAARFPWFDVRCFLWSVEQCPLPASCVCPASTCRWCMAGVRQWWWLFGWSEPKWPSLTASCLPSSQLCLACWPGAALTAFAPGLLCPVAGPLASPSAQQCDSWSLLLPNHAWKNCLSRQWLAWPLTLDLLCDPSVCVKCCVLLHFISLHFLQY